MSAPETWICVRCGKRKAAVQGTPCTRCIVAIGKEMSRWKSYEEAAAPWPTAMPAPTPAAGGTNLGCTSTNPGEWGGGATTAGPQEPPKPMPPLLQVVIAGPALVFLLAVAFGCWAGWSRMLASWVVDSATSGCIDLNDMERVCSNRGWSVIPASELDLNYASSGAYQPSGPPMSVYEFTAPSSWVCPACAKEMNVYVGIGSGKRMVYADDHSYRHHEKAWALFAIAVGLFGGLATTAYVVFAAESLSSVPWVRQAVAGITTSSGVSCPGRQVPKENLVTGALGWVVFGVAMGALLTWCNGLVNFVIYTRLWAIA